MQHRGLDFLKRVEADLPENMVVEQDAKLEAPIVDGSCSG